MATAEHYAECGNTKFYISAGTGMLGLNPPSFAGPYIVRPVTAGNPPVSNGDDPSNPRITFQVRPPLDRCDSTIAQTGHTAGMVISLLDGSVRTLKAGIDPAVYWGATTPNGGEIITLD